MWNPDIVIADWLLSGEKRKKLVASEFMLDLRKKFSSIHYYILTGQDYAMTWCIENKVKFLDKELLDILPVMLKDDLAASTEHSESEEANKQNVTEGIQEQHGVLHQRLHILRQELCQEIRFNKDFSRLCFGVVDRKLKLDQIHANLMRFLITHLNCIAAVYISYREGTILFTEKKENYNMIDFKMEYIGHHDFGSLGSIRNRLLNEKENEAAKQVGIINNISNDNAFGGFKTGSLKHANQLLFIHIYNIFEIIEQDKDTESASENPIGSFMLFTHQNVRQLSEKDEERIRKLPISSICQSAFEMPFRFYERKGFFIEYTIETPVFSKKVCQIVLMIWYNGP